MNIIEYKSYLQQHISTAWHDHGIFAAEMIKLLEPKIIVDLGVDEGYSSFCFAAYNIGRIYGIDAFTGDLMTGEKHTLPKVIKLQYDINEKYGINNISFIPGYFDEIAKEWNKEIDILHIDGFHSYDAVKNDHLKWSKFCHKNSIILFHDVNSYHQTVGTYFYEINGYKIIRDQSAGLGILTYNRDLYEALKNLSENFPG